MAVNNIISRSNAEVLIPAQQTKEIVQGAIAQSLVLQHFKRLPDMSSNVTVMPVLDLLPEGYFVNGDTGLKQTSFMDWKDKKIYAEEIAVIVPIPEAVLDDAAYDIFGEVQPRVEEAFGKVIDGAIIFGKDKPTSWRQSIVDSANAAGTVVTSTGDLFIDVFGEDGTISQVENNGFFPDAMLTHVGMRGQLRGLRDKNNNPLFVRDKLREGSEVYALDGEPLYFSRNGAWDRSKAELITGDLQQAVYSIRQDMTVKLLDQAVISDNDGKVILNLAQQDSVALRFVMRLGWEVPNPINALNTDSATRFPFSVLVKGSGEGRSFTPETDEPKKGTKAWYQAELDAYGVEYLSTATVAELKELYDAKIAELEGE